MRDFDELAIYSDYLISINQIQVSEIIFSKAVYSELTKFQNSVGEIYHGYFISFLEKTPLLRTTYHVGKEGVGYGLGEFYAKFHISQENQVLQALGRGNYWYERPMNYYSFHTVYFAYGTVEIGRGYGFE